MPFFKSGSTLPRRSATVPLVALLWFGGHLHAAEPADPTAKLREQLRGVMLQLRTSQTEAANARVAQATAEQKNADVQAALKQAQARAAELEKQAAADQAASREAMAKLDAKVAERERQLAQYQQSLEQWKEGYQKAAAAALAGQQQSAALQATLDATRNTLADRERKNVAMFNTANEILTRYESYALGKALAAKEPFIGTARVKIENLVQGYKDKILDQRLQAPAAKP